MLRHATSEALESIGDMGLSPQEEIIARLDLFRRYRGPVIVETDVPGIPGAVYASPNAEDDEIASGVVVGRVSGEVRSTGHYPKDAVVKVNEVEGEPPVILLPHQIRSVELDHPRRQDLPLFGRHLPMLGRVAMPNGDVVFGRSSDAPRYRFETGTHSRYPGIGVVMAYPAFDPQAPDNDPYNVPSQIPSLEEIKKMGLQAAATFYMSKIVTCRYVVTSRMDNVHSSPVTVPRWREREGPVDVDMTDIARDSSDGELLSQHIRQFRWLKGEPFAQPTAWRSPFITDALFLRILEG